MFTGLRAGEKLYEELLADSDRTVATVHPRLRVALLNASGDPDPMSAIATMGELQGDRAERETREWLVRHVPEYRPAAGDRSSLTRQ